MTLVSLSQLTILLKRRFSCIQTNCFMFQLFNESPAKCLRNASLFNSDISGWNVANNRDFGHMFHLAISFNQNLTDWDVTR